MALGQASWLDSIPGGQAGINWLMGQVAAFNRLPAQVTSLQAAAVLVKRAAEARGRLDLSAQMAAAMTGLSDVSDQYRTTSAHFADVMDGLRTSTPGTMPSSLVSSAIQTGAEVAALFASVQAFQGSIYGAGAQVLNADELARLRAGIPPGGWTGFGSLGGYGKWAALLGIGYVALLVVSGRGKRRRHYG